LFDQAVSAAAMPIGWSAATGDPVQAFTRAAACSDLVVIGQSDPGNELRADVQSDFVPSVIIGSGRPALVLPHHHEGGDIGRVALLAWKPTREAAHALAGALPLLCKADKVHVALWNEGEDTSSDGREDIDRSMTVPVLIAH
jgi:hypothetical protein